MMPTRGKQDLADVVTADLAVDEEKDVASQTAVGFILADKDGSYVSAALAHIEIALEVLEKTDAAYLAVVGFVLADKGKNVAVAMKSDRCIFCVLHLFTRSGSTL